MRPWAEAILIQNPKSEICNPKSQIAPDQARLRRGHSLGSPETQNDVAKMTVEQILDFASKI